MYDISPLLTKEMTKIVSIAQWAGKILLDLFLSESLDIRTKRDETDFVTKADIASDTFIQHQLQDAFPKQHIVTEETLNQPKNREQAVRVVDPLDWTKNFIAWKNEFAVMIGRCVQWVPNLWVIHFPVSQNTYIAQTGYGARKLTADNTITPIKTQQPSNIKNAKIRSTIYHLTKRYASYLQANKQILTNTHTDEYVPLISGPWSIWYNCCLLAEWSIDVYISLHDRTGKRDTCAPQVILQEAWWVLTNTDGTQLDYTQSSHFRERWHIATTQTLHEHIVEFLQ